MTYTVTLTFDTDVPLSIEALEDVAEIGGAAGGNPGGFRVDTTLTVESADLANVLGIAVERIVERLHRHGLTGRFVSGEVIAVLD